MAIIRQLYKPFAVNLLKGRFPDLESPAVVLKVALLYEDATEDPYVFDPDHETWGDVEDYEVTDADYTPGGETIANKEVNVVGNTVVLDTTIAPKETVFCAPGSIKASHAVLYWAANGAADSKLVGCLDFDGVKESYNAVFKIEWHDDGILVVDIEQGG